MNDITNEAPEDFVKKVKELLEAMTGKPYGIMEKEDMKGSVWGVYLDEEKVKGLERLSINHGAQWVVEDKDGAIRIHSDFFFDVGDAASELYGVHFRDVNVLEDRKNWEKYRKEVPGLIAELEAAERIANKVNTKYDTNIALKFSLGHHPYLETSFDAKGMSDEEKLREIEKHARAMLETWKRKSEWRDKVGLQIYKKTTKSWKSRCEFMEVVNSRLNRITRSMLSQVAFRRPGVRWALVGLVISEPPPENRGVWLIEEKRDGIAIFSDNFETINARSELEYNSIKVMGGVTACGYEEQFSILFTRRYVDERGRKMSVQITPQDAMKYGRKAIVNPQLLESIAEQVSREFKVDIQVMKDRPVLMTEFKTKGLKKNDKLYEIERRAKALAEAWRRMKELAKEEEDTKA